MHIKGFFPLNSGRFRGKTGECPTPSLGPLPNLDPQLSQCPQDDETLITLDPAEGTTKSEIVLRLNAYFLFSLAGSFGLSCACAATGTRGSVACVLFSGWCSIIGDGKVEVFLWGVNLLGNNMEGLGLVGLLWASSRLDIFSRTPFFDPSSSERDLVFLIVFLSLI